MAAVLVSGVSFDTIKGLPQVPITSQQIFNVYANCFAIGMKDPEPAGDGRMTIVTEARLADESTCAHRANLCRALAGNRADIQVDSGITYSNQVILSVDCEWKRVRGFAGGLDYILTAKWSILPTEDKPTITLAEVWTAQQWGKWVRQNNVYCMEASEGLGMYAGEAELIQKVGTVDSDPSDPVSIMGQYVEIRAKESPSSPRTIPIWWGVITKRDIGRIPSGAEVRYQCAGLAEILRQSVLTRWYEQYFLLDGSTSKTCDPGEILPFNDRPIGNRSTASTFTIGTAAPRQTLNVPMHSRATVPHHKFTALDAMKMVIAALNEQYPFGPVWRLSGQISALDYFLSEDFQFHTILDTISGIAAAVRGITFKINVPLTADNANNNANKSDIYADISISTGLPGILTIDAVSTPTLNAIQIPAAAKQVATDFSPTNVTRWDYSTDYSEVYDIIYIQGENDARMTSAGYDDDEWANDAITINGQVTKAWTAAEEAAWDALPPGGTERDQPKYAHVWRRFKLKPLFYGICYAGNLASIPCKRTVRKNADNTIEGSETGEFERDETNDPPISGEAWKILRSFPGSEQETDADITAGAIDYRKTHGRPYAYLDQAGSFEDVTHVYQLHALDDMGGFELGRDTLDAENIKSDIKGGKKLVFTFAYSFHKPWRISWRRAPATITDHFSSLVNYLQPKDQPRAIMLHASGENYRRRKIDPYCIVGLNTASITDPVIAPAAGVDIYTPGSIYQLMELAKLKYANPRVRASWTISGAVDINPASLYQTQTLITTTTVPYPDRDDESGVPINGVITRRKWNFAVGQQSMSYSVEPTLPELTAMGVAATGFGESQGFR